MPRGDLFRRKLVGFEQKLAQKQIEKVFKQCGLGVAATGVYVLIASSLVWLILKYTVGIRVSEEEELEGVDISECGLEAYPEFSSK